MSAIMALRERHLQNFVPRKPESTTEEAIDSMEDDWVTYYEENDFSICDLLAGTRWFIRFKESSQLEVMIHEVVFFMDEQRENWTRSRHRYRRIERVRELCLMQSCLFARTLYGTWE